jgi:hypothetical protein
MTWRARRATVPAQDVRNFPQSACQNTSVTRAVYACLMSAELERHRVGGPDPGKWDLLLIALLFAVLWMFLHLAMTLRL